MRHIITKILSFAEKLSLEIKALLLIAPIVILIKNGNAKRIKGDISEPLIAKYTETAKSNSIKQGLIIITNIKGYPVLRFSGKFSSSAKQKFRNIWFAQSERKITKV